MRVIFCCAGLSAMPSDMFCCRNYKVLYYIIFLCGCYKCVVEDKNRRLGSLQVCIYLIFRLDRRYDSLYYPSDSLSRKH
jgi:hypothetical protein